MFGSIGMPELILIFIVALLVFGPKKLPEIGKSLGKGLAEFKRASEELKKTIEQEIEQGKSEVSAVREEVASIPATLKSAAPFESNAAPAGESAASPLSAGTEGTPDASTPSEVLPAGPAATTSQPDTRPIEPS
jgi:TatA/E family protein of Tat protein translocase